MDQQGLTALPPNCRRYLGRTQASAMKKLQAELGPGAQVVAYQIIPDPQYPDHPHHEIIAQVPGYLLSSQSLMQQQAMAQQSGQFQQPAAQQQQPSGQFQQPSGQFQQSSGQMPQVAPQPVAPGAIPPTMAPQQSPLHEVKSEGAEFTPMQGPQEGVSSGVGGLEKQLAQIREVVVLPVRYPEMFERLGIEAPRGVLMYGPPGCGKTLTAKTMAKECGAKFFTINGPELLGGAMGESEKNLRDIFDQAIEAAPSLIFFDEIDSIAGDRSTAGSGAEKRLVTQLLTLMDGVDSGKTVITLAATNLPDSLDPALRRPGRFDRELELEPPDAKGRLEILKIHSKRIVFGTDVDLESIAERAHGYVGADLAAVCKEAGMAAVHEAFPDGQTQTQSMDNLHVDMKHFEVALEKVKPSMMREGSVEGPKITWADIGGLEEVKKDLHEAIVMPLKEPELFAKMGIKPSKGVLLAGPPGTGKTLIAKAAANECGVNFIAVQGPQLVSKFVGESEQAIRDIFSRARKVSPCIIFFDEMDAVAPVRSDSGGDDHGNRLVAQLLVEMDGFNNNDGIFCLAATNRPDAIDPAVRRPGRFDKVINVPLPDEASRRKILEVHLKGKALEPTVDVEAVFALTDGLSGAEIGEGIRRAAMAAVRNAYSGQGRTEPAISQTDLISSLEELRKTAGKEEVKAAPSQLQALVLDDELMPRELAAASLMKAGFKVDKFDDPEKAIEALQSKHYDMATFDVDMPKMSGLEALAKVREFLPNLPVIMATGRKDAETAVSSFRLGVLDFLNKPYTPDQMMEAAQKAVGALRE